jgi:hypothetical protein
MQFGSHRKRAHMKSFPKIVALPFLVAIFMGGALALAEDIIFLLNRICVLE